MSVINEESLMELNTNDTLEIVGNYQIEKPKKRKRKKIRRLVDSGDHEINGNAMGKKYKRVLIIITLIIFVISLFMGHYFTKNDANTQQLLKEFLKNYRRHYREIVYGKTNYCDEKLNIETLFARLEENHILHQEQALNEIKLALRNESALNIIAVVGPVGVGKTLFIRLVQQHFPWPENVHTYAWNTYVNDEAKKFNLIRVLVENLSECGQNLLVIDNLQFCDHGVVASINQMLMESNKKQYKRVALFYVFNLNTMLSDEAYAVQRDFLQSLPDCDVVYFKPFTQHELKDCVQREAKIENVVLTKEDCDEIVETIDPLKSGCKNVNAKVLMYGRLKH